MTDQVQFNVPGITPELNQAVAEEMERLGKNRNEVVVAILAEDFKVRFRPNGRHTTRTSESPAEWHLKMPRQLRTKINVKAKRTETSARDLVVAVLSEEFGVEFVPVFHTKRRRASWKREAA